MKVFFVIFIAIAIVWPIICWASYRITGWGKFEKKFTRDVTRDTLLATSVGFKKFGTYNACVFVGVEDYGVSFSPMIVLLFHHSLSIPWIQILSYRLQVGRLSTLCILHTAQGDVRIYGDVAEIVARGCEGHYVTKS